MNRLERFYKIDHLLQELKIVPRDRFLAELEISLATFKRDLEYMRDRFNAPVIYDSELRGYCYESQSKNKIGSKFSLPGLWFTEQEIYALITMQQLLDNLDQGSIIGPHIDPFLSRLDAIIGEGESSSKEIRKRVKLVEMGRRVQGSHFFSDVGAALFKRQRVEIQYYARAKNEITVREISPQRLVHYRDNWYLDAWCHLRNDLRGFSLDGIRSVISVNKKAIDLSVKSLDQFLATSYGIFAGEAKHRAKLKFTPERARWVAAELWHPEQKGSFDESGAYILEFPYADDRELVLDIARHGSAVEVLSPKMLREKIRKEHEAAFKQYNR
jgi:predicted DNA-binding transcriptional regulator YafY